jgi:predicted Zn-dependent peptidase
MQTVDQFEKAWVAVQRDGVTVMHNATGVRGCFQLGVVVKTGSRNESEANAGVSHFLEHMMFRGSKLHPSARQLAIAFESLGGEWNAATGYEHTEYLFSGARPAAEGCLELFAEFFANPLFLDIETERKVIQREIEGDHNEHGYSTDTDFHLSCLFWPDTPLARPIYGSVESVGAIALDEIKAYRSARYGKANCVGWVVGEASEALVGGFAENLFHPGAPTPPPVAENLFHAHKPGPHFKLVPNPDNEYEIRISFVTFGEGDNNSTALRLLSRILGDGFSSRVVSRIREELGLVYMVEVSPALHSNFGTFDIIATVTPDRCETFVNEVIAILEQIKKNVPTELELAVAKWRALTDAALSPNRGEDQGFRRAWGTLIHTDLSITKELRQLESITSEQISALAAEIFRPERLALVALGPESNEIEAAFKRSIAKFSKS